MVEQHGKTLVPQIRFAGFTDPWEQRKLGEVANVCSGRDYKHLAEGPIPVYGTGGYMTSVSKALSYDEDAIGIGRKGTIDKPYRLRAPFWTVDTLFYAIPEASLDINFLLCSFLNVDWKSKDESTGLPSLSKRAINETEVLVPDIGEQRRIGAFFDRLDSLITLHQRKYDKLCVLKKSMLDKMFPKGGSLYPEIRFAGFADPWEQRKLGELTESYSGGTPAAGESEFYGGSIPFIRSAEIASKSTELFLTGKGYESSSARMVKPGDVLYALYGATSGEVAVSKQKGAINQAILAILPHDDCDARYLAAWLRRRKDYIVTTFLQGGQGNLSGVIVKNLEVAIPSLPEQQRIGSCLSLLDSLITLHQRKLELLRNIKKSMLDKMFV